MSFRLSSEDNHRPSRKAKDNAKAAIKGIFSNECFTIAPELPSRPTLQRLPGLLNTAKMWTIKKDDYKPASTPDTISEMEVDRKALERIHKSMKSFIAKTEFDLTVSPKGHIKVPSDEKRREEEKRRRMRIKKVKRGIQPLSRKNLVPSSSKADTKYFRRNDRAKGNKNTVKSRKQNAEVVSAGSGSPSTLLPRRASPPTAPIDMNVSIHEENDRVDTAEFDDEVQTLEELQKRMECLSLYDSNLDTSVADDIPAVFSESLPSFEDELTDPNESPYSLSASPIGMSSISDETSGENIDAQEVPTGFEAPTELEVPKKSSNSPDINLKTPGQKCSSDEDASDEISYAVQSSKKKPKVHSKNSIPVISQQPINPSRDRDVQVVYTSMYDRVKMRTRRTSTKTSALAEKSEKEIKEEPVDEEQTAKKSKRCRRHQKDDRSPSNRGTKSRLAKQDR